VFCEQLADMLTQSYTLISKVEESMVHSAKKFNLSINEVHLLEVLGKGEETGRTISDIAAQLSVTLSSVTIAVNKLGKKGYVVKRRDPSDKRLVYVQLTDQGRRVNRLHRRFHRSMAYNIARDFSDEERDILLSSLSKMNLFLGKKVKKLEDNK
jgi:DNA-binding MarR family transcriptional regulator